MHAVKRVWPVTMLLKRVWPVTLLYKGHSSGSDLIDPFLFVVIHLQFKGCICIYLIFVHIVLEMAKFLAVSQLCLALTCSILFVGVTSQGMGSAMYTMMLSGPVWKSYVDTAFLLNIWDLSLIFRIVLYLQQAEIFGNKVDWTDVKEGWRSFGLDRHTGELHVMRHLVMRKLKLFADSWAVKQKRLHEDLS